MMKHVAERSWEGPAPQAPPTVTRVDASRVTNLMAPAHRAAVPTIVELEKDQSSPLGASGERLCLLTPTPALAGQRALPGCLLLIQSCCSASFSGVDALRKSVHAIRNSDTPHGREAAVIHACSLINAARATSTASESDLLACGMTEDEIADLEMTCASIHATPTTSYGAANEEH